MAPPALFVFIQGQATTSADNLNTFPQSCDNAAQLRAFIGSYTMCVYLRGFTVPGDGGGGMFYWNASSNAADNGTTIFAPAGVSTGRWIRVPEYTVTSNISSITLTTSAGVAAPVLYDTGANIRWSAGKNTDAESGANAGSNYEIDAYNDAGTLLGYAVKITRSSQVTDFPFLPTIATATLISALPAFVGSGVSHAKGLVPDPGASVGSPLRFLREDGTFAANAAAVVPIRQTVLSGPIAADGSPSLLPASASGLTLTTQNVAASTNIATGSGPLIATAANGFSTNTSVDTTGTVTSNISWTLPDASTSYLFVTVSAGSLTAGNTTTAPIYQYGNAPSVSNGQYTYVIKNSQMYLGNGSVANPVQVVFVGEAVTSGGNITSPGTVAYAYQGYAEYNDTGSLPGTTTQTTKNHNIGISDANLSALGVKATLSVICHTAEGGFSVGDVLDDPYGAAASTIFSSGLTISRNVWSFMTWNVTPWQTLNKTSGALFTLTAANWRYRLTAKRQW
jgi:hypothetical protein